MHNTGHNLHLEQFPESGTNGITFQNNANKDVKD